MALVDNVQWLFCGRSFELRKRFYVFLPLSPLAKFYNFSFLFFF